MFVSFNRSKWVANLPIPFQRSHETSMRDANSDVRQDPTSCARFCFAYKQISRKMTSNSHSEYKDFVRMSLEAFHKWQCLPLFVCSNTSNWTRFLASSTVESLFWPVAGKTHHLLWKRATTDMNKSPRKYHTRRFRSKTCSREWYSSWLAFRVVSLRKSQQASDIYKWRTSASREHLRLHEYSCVLK